MYFNNGKEPVITIPAGPGMGKSEVVSRIVKNCDQYIGVYSNSLELKNWLPCAVTFNFASELTVFELSLYKTLEPGY